MDCVCVPFRGGRGKRESLSAFERGLVVGARRTGLCQELQGCWVFHSQHFPMYIKNGPPPKGHPANLTQLCEALESTWASIGINMGQHPCVTLMTTCQNVLLIFCILSVYPLILEEYDS